MFVGINPSLRAAEVGHHFAGPGNRFWPTLYAAGFTPRLLAPDEDGLLPSFGLGVVSFVARATRSASELSDTELRAGASALEATVGAWRPGLVAVVGVGAYRSAFDRPHATLGLQEQHVGGRPGVGATEPERAQRPLQAGGVRAPVRRGAPVRRYAGLRMEIRPLRETDAAAIQCSLLGDPEIAAWLRSTGPFTLEECEEMVARKIAHRTAHGFGWSLAWEGDTCVGWGIAQYCIVDGASEVEVGWTVARSHWRRGIATRLGRHALTEVTGRGLYSVVAYALKRNVASRGVMSKLGMTYEKNFELQGEPHVLYRKALAAD